MPHGDVRREFLPLYLLDIDGNIRSDVSIPILIPAFSRGIYRLEVMDDRGYPVFNIMIVHPDSIGAHT